MFLDKLNEFDANFAIDGLTPLIIFLDDMRTINATYQTPEGIQTVNNIINTFRTQAQAILQQEIQLQKTKNPNALTPTEEDLKIPQYIQILTDRARKAKLL